MPLHEFHCPSCGRTFEELVWGEDVPACPGCGSAKTERLLSASSSLTGKMAQAMPGAGDTGCCGSSPGSAAGCAGPGSCCGKVQY